jgi:FkbM family methyltransferase
MSVFLDCGTNLCQGLKAHIERYGIDQSWKVYSFEANPYTYRHAQNIINRHYSHLNISLLNVAVWTDDGYLPIAAEYASAEGIFTLLKDNGFDSNCVDLSLDNALWVGGASNAMGDEYLRTQEMNELRFLNIKTRSIDFIEFVEKLDDNDIFIKMDIEGAEYKVLDKLLASSAILRVREITVEWHNHILTQPYDNEYIINRLIGKGVSVKQWH